MGRTLQKALDDIITAINSFKKDINNFLIIKSYDTNLVHEGNVYIAHDVSIIGNGGTRNILLITPNSAIRGYLKYTIETAGEASIYIFEDSTVSANGTALSIPNRDRESTNTSEMFLFHTPTILTDGNELHHNKTGVGKEAGGSFYDFSETILKRNSKYIIRVTNDTTSDNWCVIRLNWYEE